MVKFKGHSISTQLSSLLKRYRVKPILLC